MGGIQSINWQMRNGQLTIGIPNPAERGKGYGGDAVRVLLRYAFWELNLGRAWLHVAAYNSAAIACFQKVGFQLEATLREAVYRDLQYHDMQVMGILYEEWQEHNDGE
jgi:RimJ/RimL family protein N-acetyltransferase